MSCALAGRGPPGALRAGDEVTRQPAPRLPARAGPPGDRRRRVRRHLWADHAGGHPGGARRRDPRRARRGSSGRDPSRREPFRRGRARQPQRPLAGLGSVLRAPRHLDRRGVDLLGARESAARRRGARAGRVPRRGGAGGPASRDPRLVRAAAMIGSLAVLLVGLGIAGASAAVGVATAAVSQLELTRWVSYKLRRAGAPARLLENPGPRPAPPTRLTTLGIICAAASSPALLAQTTATFLGVFTVTVGVPLFVSAASLVPRVVGRRWAEPIVAHAVPWLERHGMKAPRGRPRRSSHGT